MFKWVKQNNFAMMYSIFYKYSTKEKIFKATLKGFYMIWVLLEK